MRIYVYNINQLALTRRTTSFGSTGRSTTAPRSPPANETINCLGAHLVLSLRTKSKAQKVEIFGLGSRTYLYYHLRTCARSGSRTYLGRCAPSGTRPRRGSSPTPASPPPSPGSLPHLSPSSPLEHQDDAGCSPAPGTALAPPPP